MTKLYVPGCWGCETLLVCPRHDRRFQQLLLVVIALVACACSGPIGLGSAANLTETVCVVPSGEPGSPGAVTVEDIADAAAVWHASDARVNMTVRALADGPQSECDTVVSAEKQGYPCAATTMTGEHIYLDLHDGCDLRTVEPHELGHLLLGGEHSEDPADLMYSASVVFYPSAADLARLDAVASAR
jgi:hypothetical protein